MTALFAIVLAVVGVASAAYGFAFVFSETKNRFFYFWFVLAAALIAPAILMAVGAWNGIPLALRCAVGLVLLLFVVYEVVVFIAIGRHFNEYAADGLDYVVALGAQVLSGKPGRTFSRRLNAAREYLCRNPRSRCIVCGAQGSNEEVPEAHAGRDYLVERGIDSNRILLEDRSYSTVQNLQNAAKLVDPTHDAIAIVTSNFHMARSLAIARKSGFNHVSGIAVETNRRELLNSIVRESFAWAKDILSGNA